MKPITFSGPMIKAILAGRKTQTRRVIKTQPPPEVTHCNYLCRSPVAGLPLVEYHWMCGPGRMDEDEFIGGFFECPYGCPPFDLLWVREAWRPYISVGTYKSGIYYPADGTKVEDERAGPLWSITKAQLNRQAMFMPKWVSRISLRIKKIRVDRLQSISFMDAAAEGMQPCPETFKGTTPEESLTAAYTCEWDKINEKRGYPWKSNPWVWVIEFERIVGDE